jgi:hypothetical protein
MRRTTMSGRPRSRILPSRPAGTLIANEVGDDAAALAARRRLAPLPEKIQDPSCMRYASWPGPGLRRPPATSTAPCGRRRSARASSAARTSPFFTALAAYTAALGETALGRPDGALPHLRETRDLADRFVKAWLTLHPGCSRAHWPSCKAGQTKPGSYWMRR